MVVLLPPSSGLPTLSQDDRELPPESAKPELHVLSRPTVWVDVIIPEICLVDHPTPLPNSLPDGNRPAGGGGARSNGAGPGSQGYSDAVDSVEDLLRKQLVAAVGHKQRWWSAPPHQW